MRGCDTWDTVPKKNAPQGHKPLRRLIFRMVAAGLEPATPTM